MSARLLIYLYWMHTALVEPQVLAHFECWKETDSILEWKCIATHQALYSSDSYLNQKTHTMSSEEGEIPEAITVKYFQIFHASFRYVALSPSVHQIVTEKRKRHLVINSRALIGPQH